MRIDPDSVRLLRDLVLVRRLPLEHATLAMPGVTLNRGVIHAVGPGRRVKRLVRYKAGEGMLGGDIYLPDGPETGKIRPMRVQPEQVVEFSPYKHQLDFEWEGEKYVIIPEQSIYGVDHGNTTILHQRIAGYERGGTFLAR